MLTKIFYTIKYNLYMIKSVFPSTNAGIFGRLLLSPPDFWEALITFPGSGYFGNLEVI